ncbi:hypothetical protein SODALDRAFT_327126 [Sodiomyces alkalinus F11]|uniref:BZIP domain-containing protein n=1 Tax=Sodiomyces alkalinus (strain CBS 110278 / VKM F-3762 / F11) TaxID=1314773 RepID=A0A3N2Q894_SODAK|nr:hypothetical protein SODALDRAFT_327126 [Sodiomyces alkalinus F11]ROT42960.1 hypothetical protein SODALDRAFT_327126 [Sodiomyces alkalinus F11]
MASSHSVPRVHNVHLLELQRMPHEVNIRHRGEDWAGITDPKERKKLQNRLNKRVSRQRKRRLAYDSASPGAVSPGAASPDATSPDGVSTIILPRFDAKASPLDNLITTFSHCSEENVSQKRARLKRFAEQALTSYLTADPCADHHLKVIQLNIINGFTRNAAALGFNFDWLICDSISPFGRDGESSKSGTTAIAPSVPTSLRPTNLQLTTKHHPWLDLFPLPKMRDNLLIAASVLTPEDEQRLFEDVMESGGGKNEWAGLAVWGDPWEPQSWEISAPFLRNWKWLIRGCPEIIVSTNHWRSQRGEKPIGSPSDVLE